MSDEVIRILLVDDKVELRQNIRRLLSFEDDIEIAGEASNGQEAIDACRQFRPALVLMDINMPKLSGIDATRQLEKAGCPSKILVLSMHESRAYVEEVLRAGAAGYVVKNSASKDVANAIDAVRSGASYLSPAITRQVVDAIARPSDKGPSGISMLTERECEVLRLITDGLSSKEIASDLGVSLKTIDSHRSKNPPLIRTPRFCPHSSRCRVGT